MFSELEEQRIVRAIANAERDNRGEVQVRVERRCCVGDALVRAQALYKLAGLEGTADDTGVLLYVASESHVSAVYCGAGVHARSDASFWQGVSDRVAAGYRNGKPVDGICDALGHIGDLLRTLLPGRDDAGNERPNTLHTEEAAKRDTALDELTPDVFLCVGCGAQVSFREEEGRQIGDASLERATCPYCGTVNDRALALLRKQHAAERHAARLREEQQKRTRMFAFAAALALVVLVGIAAASTHTELRELHTQVERARSQVQNVRERQVAVVTRFAGAEPSVGREAELSGAENRVRIERMRYDEAAATYNAAAGSGWASLWAKLTALPARAPLSNEAQW